MYLASSIQHPGHLASIRSAKNTTVLQAFADGFPLLSVTAAPCNDSTCLLHPIQSRREPRESPRALKRSQLLCRRFAEGFPNLFVPGAHDIRNRHVAFLASFHSPTVIFEQISIIYALPRMFVASFTLVLPFFPTGTAERMENEGDIATAFTLSRILSNIPISRGGPTSVVIFDIHALQVSL
jgi:hypothetical protein